MVLLKEFKLKMTITEYRALILSNNCSEKQKNIDLICTFWSREIVLNNARGTARSSSEHIIWEKIILTFNYAIFQLKSSNE